MSKRIFKPYFLAVVYTYKCISNLLMQIYLPDSRISDPEYDRYTPAESRPIICLSPISWVYWIGAKSSFSSRFFILNQVLCSVLKLIWYIVRTVSRKISLITTVKHFRPKKQILTHGFYGFLHLLSKNGNYNCIISEYSWTFDIAYNFAYKFSILFNCSIIP